MAYASPRAGVLNHAEHLGGNFYRIEEDLDEPYFNGMIVFVATDACLKKIWQDYFDVAVNQFEYTSMSPFQSFLVVTGKRTAQAI